MEFILKNPQKEGDFLQSIEFNFEELKTELTVRLEKYQNLTYTEETIKLAKEDRAGLNKFKEAIENRRKEIKKLCLKPYNDFEAKVKELTALIDEPILAIDTQIKNFETQKAEVKQREIREFYNSVIGDLANLVAFEKLYNPKWLNATYKLATIQKEITEQLEKIRSELNVLESLKLEAQIGLQVQDKYLQTLSFSAAMAEKARLENLQAAIKQREEAQKIIELTPQPEVVDVRQPLPTQEKRIYYREFYVKGTREQLLQLAEFMNKNGIEYGGIAK